MPSNTRAAIVGVGQTDFGMLYANKDARRNAQGLAAEALRAAIADAGIAKDDIDGLVTSWGRLRTDGDRAWHP